MTINGEPTLVTSNGCQTSMTSNDELTPQHRRKYGVPSGGQWFHRQDSMLALLTTEDQFMVAWDISPKSASKCYGIYDNFRTFWEVYIQTPPSSRWGYELVRKDRLAKIYFDIEFWTKQGDTEHTKLRMFLKHLRERIEAEGYDIRPEIYVVVGSRPDKGMIKNSYHVVVENYACSNNHDGGTMLQLARETTELGDEWKTVKPNGKVVDIVDTSVYKKNQLIRLLASAKRSSQATRPFDLLSLDGFYLEECMEPQDDYDWYEGDLFRISNPKIDGDRRLFKTELTLVAQKKPQQQRVKARQSDQAQVQASCSQASNHHPFLLDDIKTLLAQCGDTISQVYSVARPDPERDEYAIKCNQRKQARPCLHNPSLMHESNTMRLYAIREGDRYRIEYHCFGSACSDLRNKTIGHVPATDASADTQDNTTSADTQNNTALDTDSQQDLGAALDTDVQRSMEMMYNLSTADDQPMGEEPQEMEVEVPIPPPPLNPPAPTQPLHPPPAAPTQGFHREPNERYSEPLVRDLPTDQRVLAIAAPCGTGKTKAFVRFIQSMAEQSELTIVYVSHRKALTEKAMATLPPLNGNAWHSYKGTKTEIDLRKTPLVVIQYEALGRLKGYSNHSNQSGQNNTSKLILVLDEFNSICHQMHSKYGDPVMAQLVFYQLMQCASCAVAMDGYLDQHRVDILEKYAEQPAYLIHNTFKSRSNHIVNHTRDVTKTVSYILQCLSEGSHIICPCMSKKQAEDLYTQAKTQFGDSKSVILYTRDNTWKGEDVNVAWASADLLIYTSTIDCGISFEVSGHFDLCVCLFDDSTGPTIETALQMLSRSRDTRRFLICTKQKLTPKQTTDPNQVLAEMDAKIATHSDGVFFGIRYSLRHRRRDWASCNPYLAAFVMSCVIQRRTTNNMSGEILDMLQRDGAQVMARQMDFAAALAQAQQPDPQPPQPPPDQPPVSIEIPGRSAEVRVAKLRQEYKFDGFDPENTEALERYERADVLGAFRNLTMLARNGTDFISAIRRRRRDVAKSRAGHEYARQSGKFSEPIISRSETLAGVEGDNYDYDANKAASKLTQFFTGVQNPFSIPSITQDELEARFQCGLVRMASKKRRRADEGEEEPKEREVLCLSLASKAQFKGFFDEWILCEPRLHAPYRIPGDEPLTLIRAIHLFSHTLSVMYNMEFKRQSNARRTGAARRPEYVYTTSDIGDFHRLLKGPCDDAAQDQVINATKPQIPSWCQEPLQDLSEADVLQSDGRIIQPGLEFARRQAVDFCSHDLPGIKDDRPMTREEWVSVDTDLRARMSVKLPFEDGQDEQPKKKKKSKHEQMKWGGTEGWGKIRAGGSGS
jgi:hypothetical protein